jgi:hypothetical protein
MDQLSVVAKLPDRELLAFATRAGDKERGGTVELIAALMEIDKRRLYLDEGHSSLYSYCTSVLKLSEHAAYGRITAARVAMRFSRVLGMLERKEITLTTITLLASVLKPENADALLTEARGKTRREVEELVVSISPRPPAAASIVPLAPGSYRLQCTIGQQAHDELRFAQDVLRHVSPDGDIVFLVERAFSLQGRELRRERLGETVKPRRPALRRTNTRHIPASVQREVLRRDGCQCAFVGRLGRCESRAFLEFHHVKPYAAGGEATTAIGLSTIT